jgi:hypothetical protein
MTSKITDTEIEWRMWLKENPKADSHQRYYAAGVIDGLRFAKNKGPDWHQTLMNQD